jgi:hypothetical protein
MRFLGIMGFISCGLFSFGGIFVAIVPGFWFFLRSEGVDIPAAPLERWAAVIAGLVYFACAVVWFFPSRWLYKTGARLRDYVRTGAEADLEEAFRANKAFWKFLGIITIISLALIPVFIIIGLIVAVGSALM